MHDRIIYGGMNSYVTIICAQEVQLVARPNLAHRLVAQFAWAPILHPSLPVVAVSR